MGSTSEEVQAARLGAIRMSAEQQAMSTQRIVFPNGNHAQAVLLPTTAHAHDLPPLLHIPPFHSVIMLVGGAESMRATIHHNLVQLFTHGIALFAATHHALIIDGGTHSGVMELIGTAIATQHHRSPLLGVSPSGLVSYPGQPIRVEHEERGPLDPNHSHFVLVETDVWGGETAIMYELAQLFSQGLPSVAIVVNGGTIAVQEMLYNVHQKRPILVLQGSGRTADDIARLWQEKPSTITDPDLAEIILHGDIHLFPVTGTAEALVQLTEQLLQL